MKIKKIKIPTYNEFNQYRKEIYECLNRNYNKKIDMWLSDSPAQSITIDCRNEYSFSYQYYHNVPKDFLADLYALIFFEKDQADEVPGFEFYTYSDHKIEIIADGIALTVKPIKQDIVYNDIWTDKPLSNFTTSNGLMINFTESNEFVCNVVDLTSIEEVMAFADLINPYARYTGFPFVTADSLDTAKKDSGVLTVVKEPLKSKYEYTIYEYTGNEFVVVSHVYRDPVQQGRELVYFKLNGVLDFLEEVLDNKQQYGEKSLALLVRDKLEAIIKEG